ncbi:ATP binding domain 1 family [Thecamonas trahens ATCC 50062]|uniref:GPN-loop GTPase 3 n=1 Tax=Thecamonas trahens ATCC 50062 TaxID=461836 RepID=A0A0L0DHD0_THETB|nr:ATP binding domain 1 family [Thecamonas trahens ATCC 50062]KNC51541.1 ATP binding domain 1 family [Thecamonas trahens ATCC 50062]|eukprot:XP_013755943.1 ATP binding domain 1 family [Thecamonas trahens ATCC 50062]
MGKKGQLVIGPAGSGKSTYCETIHRYCSEQGRTVHVVNLDPAAEVFNYPVAVDIRDLIKVDDAMDVLHFGPNGGLIYCMEYLLAHSEWLEDAIGDFDDDYLIFDCPGQIELYMHVPMVKALMGMLDRLGYTIASVYVIDSQFVSDPAKFMSANLMCLSAMLQLELPHVSVLSKVDILKAQHGGEEPEFLEDFLSPDPLRLMQKMSSSMDSKFYSLTDAIAGLLDNFSMVSFLPLDITDQDSIDYVLSTIDYAIQYGEDLELNEPAELEDEVDLQDALAAWSRP